VGIVTTAVTISDLEKADIAPPTGIPLKEWKNESQALYQAGLKGWELPIRRSRFLGQSQTEKWLGHH
jgi:hypothetical protein